MYRLLPRLPRILLASTFALSAIAMAEPAPPAPVPVPYPNVAARDPVTGLPTGKRMHKPYTVTAATETIEASAVTWGPPGMQKASDLTSDPEEGGQVYTSDPQEGGEVVRGADSVATAAAKAKGKPHVSDISVMKTTDKASANLNAAEPPPSGTATVTVGLHACVKGQHLKEVTIVHRSSRYTLHDVDVGDCTDSGDTSTCTLSYQSVG